MRRRSASFWIVAGGLLSLLCGANLAATLYAVYGQRFGFSARWPGCSPPGPCRGCRSR
jgi:hypothetical protein